MYAFKSIHCYLQNKILNKYLGETQAPWPLELSGGSPLSSFLHSKRKKKRRKKTNLLSHTFQVVDNPIHEKTEENIYALCPVKRLSPYLERLSGQEHQWMGKTQSAVTGENVWVVHPLSRVHSRGSTIMLVENSALLLMSGTRPGRWGRAPGLRADRLDSEQTDLSSDPRDAVGATLLILIGKWDICYYRGLQKRMSKQLGARHKRGACKMQTTERFFY